MNTKILFSIASFAIFAFVAIPQAEAQWGRNRMTSEEWEAWQERWQEESESRDIDYEEIERWRRQSSQLQDDIDDLDNDIVDNLPVPVLFGVLVGNLTPNFGDPRDGGARTHQGFDMLAAEGTPIVSPTEAVVIRVGSGSSSGKYVTTANPGGETFVYMHLADVADIDEGDVLEVGDVIGYVGDTGNASGGPAHLHFEIRENREALDPFPRLTKNFSLEEQMEYLENVMKDVSDEEEEHAEFLVENYLAVFVQARAADIDVPEEIEDALPATVANTPAGIPGIDLTLGSSGTEVLMLQSILIRGGYLAIAAPTSTFGPLTQSALAAYQRANNITPASGYYGAITRAHLAAAGGVQSEEELIEQLLAQVAELTELLEKLIEEREQQ